MAQATSTISSGRVFRLGAGGALGGLLTFMLLDPTMRDVETLARGESGLGHGWMAFTTSMQLGAAVGAAIGGMLILAEELEAPSALRLIRKLVCGLILGGLIGAVGTVIADMVFSPLAATNIRPIVVIGRVIGWAIMGAAAGLCPGLIAASRHRVSQGVVGGLLGGAVGGLMFDWLGIVTQGGSVSRFVGFIVTGLAIGIAVALVEEMGKVYWISWLSGSREGRSYTLTRPITSLGRDELVDVPLFGDPSVLARHASIVQNAAGASLMANAGAKVVVNGLQVNQVALRPGDVIELGRHRLRFHARAGAPLAVQGADFAPQSSYTMSPPAVNMPAGYGPAPCSSISVIQGPHAGAVFALSDGAILGRDPRCDIPLIADSRLSRQHARFMLEAGGWVVEDGNSLNGLFVNGVKVPRHLLSPGDQIGAGDSVIAVH